MLLCVEKTMLCSPPPLSCHTSHVLHVPDDSCWGDSGLNVVVMSAIPAFTVMLTMDPDHLWGQSPVQIAYVM